MLSQREQNLASLIEQRRNTLLDDLKLHVGIPTGGGNTLALDETRDRFTHRFEALGANTEYVPADPRPDWLLGGSPAKPPPTSISRRRGTLPKSVLIAGHLDTVHDPEGPFRELTLRDDGTAIGPGCVDMKGGLVIAAAALEALEEAGESVSWAVTLNSDEETGSYHSERALHNEARLHDWGIALEPALAGGELAVERGGSGQFMIETRGRSAHVGRSFTEGISAVTALAHTLVKIADIPDPALGRIVSVGPVQGGNATNAVPDRAVAWGNVRFPNDEVSAQLADMLDALATSDDILPRVIVRRSFNRAAKPMLPSTEALALTARAAAESLGQTLPFAKTGGVCDGNILQHAGLPTIDTLGVRGGGLHTPDEWIELDSLVQRCQLLAIVLLRLSEGAPS